MREREDLDKRVQTDRLKAQTDVADLALRYLGVTSRPQEWYSKKVHTVFDLAPTLNEWAYDLTDRFTIWPNDWHLTCTFKVRDNQAKWYQRRTWTVQTPWELQRSISAREAR